MENAVELINVAAVDALMGKLAECRAELDIISRVVDTFQDYHSPECIDYGDVGDFGHLAELLTQARQFITGEEEA